jgi:hypothetical protein
MASLEQRNQELAEIMEPFDESSPGQGIGTCDNQNKRGAVGDDNGLGDRSTPATNSTQSTSSSSAVRVEKPHALVPETDHLMEVHTSALDLHTNDPIPPLVAELLGTDLTAELQALHKEHRTALELQIEAIRKQHSAELKQQIAAIKVKQTVRLEDQLNLT